MARAPKQATGSAKNSPQRLTGLFLDMLAAERRAGRSFKASSVARRLSAVRQLFRFLYAEGHRGDDPASVIEGPKRGRPLPKVLSMDGVGRLLAPAHGGPPDAARSDAERLRGLRLACLLEVLYATG